MRQNADRQDTGQTARTEWRVRPARLADRDFILGITPRLAQGFELPPWRTADEVVQAESAALERALEPGSERAVLLVAEDTEGDLGGYVYVNVETDYFGRTNAHIEILTVSSSAEGRGAGRTLLEAAERWARLQGVGLITLNVFTNNQRARSVYERLGYAPESLHYVKPLT